MSEKKSGQKLFTRNFTFLILGQVSSLIGNYTLKFALSMYILEQTGSASVYAGLMAVSLIPMILLSPFGGILADRANRRNIMVTLDTLSGIIVLAAGLFLRHGNDLLLIGALLIALSVLGAFESPTVQACVPQMLSGDQIVQGNAVVNQIQAAASLIAPFSGSIFYTAFGIQPVLLAAVVCFFLTALLECFIRLDYRKQEEKLRITAVVKGDLSDSIRFLRHDEPGVLKLLLLAALISVFLTGILVVGFPYLVRTVLGLSAEHYGAAESVMGVAAILGGMAISVLAGKLNPRYAVPGSCRNYASPRRICLPGFRQRLSGAYTKRSVHLCGCGSDCPILPAIFRERIHFLMIRFLILMGLLTQVRIQSPPPTAPVTSRASPAPR